MDEHATEAAEQSDQKPGIAQSLVFIFHSPLLRVSVFNDKYDPYIEIVIALHYILHNVQANHIAEIREFE